MLHRHRGIYRLGTLSGGEGRGLGTLGSLARLCGELSRQDEENKDHAGQNAREHARDDAGESCHDARPQAGQIADGSTTISGGSGATADVSGAASDAAAGSARSATGARAVWTI